MTTYVALIKSVIRFFPLTREIHCSDYRRLSRRRIALFFGLKSVPVVEDARPQGNYLICTRAARFIPVYVRVCPWCLATGRMYTRLEYMPAQCLEPGMYV